MAEVIKTIAFPPELVFEADAVAQANERSFSAEVRYALRNHLAEQRAVVKTTESGFSQSDAEALGLTFQEQRAGTWTASGPNFAPVTFGPGSMLQVLNQVQDLLRHQAARKPGSEPVGVEG